MKTLRYAGVEYRSHEGKWIDEDGVVASIGTSHELDKAIAARGPTGENCSRCHDTGMREVICTCPAGSIHIEKLARQRSAPWPDGDKIIVESNPE